MPRRLLLYLLVLGTTAFAQPQTPTVYLNEKVRLAELAVSQRANLRFDLRPIGGQYLKVLLFGQKQDLSETPTRQWLLPKASGTERLNFDGLPLGVYTLVAYASDANGQQLAYAAPLVHVEYGGWRAWESFQPPIEKVTQPPPAFPGVDVATNIRNQDVRIGIDPPAAVLRPGGQLPLRAGFAGIEPEQLKWTLSGPGTLKAVDPYHYVYTAPPEQLGHKLIRIEIQSLVHPDLTSTSMILVTDADPDTLNARPINP